MCDSVAFQAQRKCAQQVGIRDILDRADLVAAISFDCRALGQTRDTIFDLIAMQWGINAVGYSNVAVHEIHADGFVIRHFVRML